MLSAIRLGGARVRSFAAIVTLLAVATPALAQGGPPALPVTVAAPAKRQVVDWVEFPGRFEATAMVEVRAQVSGALQTAPFRDGAIVKPGDVLFVIDPRRFEAAVRQARANVEVAQTRLDLARADLERAQDLSRTGNIPQSTFQQRQQTFLEARGSLEAARAAVESAQLDLEYSTIEAPIGGKVGRKLVTEGNLIASGSGGTLLTTIVQFEPLYFYFDVDETSFLRYLRAVAAGNREDGAGQQVFLALSDETEFTRSGKIDFLANQIDPATGTIRVRAEVPNPKNFITPGLFGRVRLATAPPREALVLPNEAIVQDQTRQLVMTVTDDGTVQPKPIKTGALIGRWRVIQEGVTERDRVIVNGLMRARPGGKVVPQPSDLQVPDNLTQPSVGG